MRRYEELDSLRGLAALTVVFCHFLLIFPAMDYLYSNAAGEGSVWVKVFIYSPLHILWGGHEAVILFFLLSGFVLTLPFLKGKQAYGPYLIRRICRIYLPYLIAVLLSVAACALLYKGALSGLSDWINMRWDRPISIKEIAAYVTLILVPGSIVNEYNPALWTLVHEMRISIIFPLVAFVTIRYNWKVTLGLSFVISIIGYSSAYVTYPFHGGEVISTLKYLPIFMIGSLLAKHRDGALLSKLPPISTVAALILGALLYTYSWWFFPHIKILHHEIINDWVITVGAAIFILFAIYSQGVSRVLQLRAIHFMGKISYSLYLYHSIVYISLLHMLHDTMPAWAILTVSLVGAFAVSSAAYYLIEQPAIKLGKALSGAVSRPRKRASETDANVRLVENQ